MVSSFCQGFPWEKKRKHFEKFWNDNFNLTQTYPCVESIYNNPPDFDVYVAGSDQIWNPNTMFGDMSYMFDFAPQNSIRIAYSSSFSCDSIPQIYFNAYKENLCKFKAIGVRESNGLALIQTITGRTDARLVLDPTLLLTKEQWNEYTLKSDVLSLPSKFILFYMLAYTYSPEIK